MEENNNEFKQVNESINTEINEPVNNDVNTEFNEPINNQINEPMNEEIKGKKSNNSNGGKVILLALLIIVVALIAVLVLIIGGKKDNDSKPNKKPDIKEEDKITNDKKDDEDKQEEQKDDEKPTDDKKTDDKKNEDDKSTTNKDNGTIKTDNKVTSEEEAFVKKVTNLLTSDKKIDRMIAEYKNESINNSYLLYWYINEYYNDSFSKHKAENLSDKCYNGSGSCQVISKENTNKYAIELFNNGSFVFDENYLAYEQEGSYYLQLGGSETIKYGTKTTTIKKANNEVVAVSEFTGSREKLNKIEYTFKYNSNHKLYLASIKTI